MHKVNREHEFNREFVRQVKMHSCLYDATSSDHKDKHLQDAAWTKIAAEVQESETDCRKRWRNLKTSTARYLKQLRQNPTNMKPYYLFEDMKFMIPFLKNKDNVSYTITVVDDDSMTSGGEPQSDKSVTEVKLLNIVKGDKYTYELEGVSSVAEDTSIGVQETKESSLTLEIPSNSDEEVKIVEAETAKRMMQEDDFGDPLGEGSTTTKKARQEVGTSSFGGDSACENSDSCFLKSLLPDIGKMNDRQKRKFKIGVIQLIDGILCPE